MDEKDKQKRNGGEVTEGVGEASGEVSYTSKVDKQELNEIKTEQVFGEEIEAVKRQAKPISEEEAKALIAADRLDVERGMAKADNHRKKVIKVVIVALVLMVVLGVGAWIVAGMLKEENGETNGNDSGAGGAMPVRSAANGER